MPRGEVGMPIYEYACQACGHTLEVIQKMSAAPLQDCPVCGKPQLKKLMSASGFQLKGSGWYATDFRGGAKKSEGSGESKGSSSDSGSDTGAKTGAATPAAAPAEPKPPKARA